MEQKNSEQTPTVSDPQATQPQQVPQTPASSSLPKKPLVIGGILIGFIFFGVGGYYLGLNQSENVANNQATISSPTPTIQATQPTTAPDITSSWNTYSSTEQGFTIKYPKKLDKYPEDWQYEELGTTDFGVGFGTLSSKPGGYIWGVGTYDNGNLEELIKQMGSQFSDRQELRQDITINGIPALLVTVTTNQYQDWMSKNVYIQKDGKIYVIGNGAIDLSEFSSFYNSFKLNN